MKYRLVPIVALVLVAGATPALAEHRISVRAGFTGSSHRHHSHQSRHEVRYVEKKVWVPCWDEIVCEQVWIPGYFEDHVTVTREYGVEVRRVCKHWVDGHYETRERTIHHEGYYTIVYERVSDCR